MIQVVGQSIPMYAISCFKLPRGFIHELNMMLVGFWWGDMGSKMRIHCRKWDDLCCSKLDRRLGFKDLENFNLVLLTK